MQNEPSLHLLNRQALKQNLRDFLKRHKEGQSSNAEKFYRTTKMNEDSAKQYCQLHEAGQACLLYKNLSEDENLHLLKADSDRVLLQFYLRILNCL